jgi:hypothetical protein
MGALKNHTSDRQFTTFTIMRLAGCDIDQSKFREKFGVSLGNNFEQFSKLVHRKVDFVFFIVFAKRKSYSTAF